MNKMSVHPTDVEGLIERARMANANGYMPHACRELISDLAQALSLLSQERATVGGDSSGAESAEPASLSRSAVVPEAEQAGGWRPIETAPKDGTPVDLWRDGERLTDWRFNPLRHGWYQERGFPVVTVYLTHPPTHWQPLPEPPEGA